MEGKGVGIGCDVVNCGSDESKLQASVPPTIAVTGYSTAIQKIDSFSWVLKWQ